ncbi:205_t:CDS:2 [Dentiscutata erythropus]|uniref:205_t:CDS:1 n=1 Tax=Dentiscutata erythropus TaxID=1348616 RepID=A0A9N8YY66_9GLOM|nr:205_t:CDS:2 [Dentiscutata erythropus]
MKKSAIKLDTNNESIPINGTKKQNTTTVNDSIQEKKSYCTRNPTTPTTKEKTVSRKKALNLRHRKTTEPTTKKKPLNLRHRKTTEPTTKKKPHYKKHQIGRHHVARNTEWETPGTRKEIPNWTTPTTNDANQQNRRTN